MLNYLFTIRIPFENTGLYLLNGVLFSYAFYVFMKNEIWKMNTYSHISPMIKDRHKND